MDIEKYFLSIEIEGVRSFKKKNHLNLSDADSNWRQWTVILGDNGLGKTTLLQAIAALSIQEDKFPGDDKPSRAMNYRQPAIEGYIVEDKYNSNIKGKVWSDGKRHDISMSSVFREGVWSGSTYKYGSLKGLLTIYSYGSNRSIGTSSLSENDFDKSTATLFDSNAKLINAEEWLLQLDYAASKDSDIKDFAIKKRNQVLESLVALLPDIEEVRFTEPTRKLLTSRVQFKTPFGWVYIHNLSLGYKSMVAWIVDLSARMFNRYPDSVDPLGEPAIVLVDEIDIHLHPKWQRKIFEFLSNRFPKTQFIVTSHSPLVVQAAPSGSGIAVIKSCGDFVTIDDSFESVQNWRIDQIMSSDLFDIKSARSPQVAELLEERKGLLQKAKLTYSERARLNELNEIANALPTEQSAVDNEAMEIIRNAANFLKHNS
jgi:predicted ATP-binding protein involved in virulence